MDGPSNLCHNDDHSDRFGTFYDRYREQNIRFNPPAPPPNLTLRFLIQWESAGPPPIELDIIVNAVMMVCLFFFAAEVREVRIFILDKTYVAHCES